MENYFANENFHNLIFTEANELEVSSDCSSRVLSAPASHPRVSADDGGPWKRNPTLPRNTRQWVAVQHPQVGAPTASRFAEHVLQHVDKNAKLRRVYPER